MSDQAIAEALEFPALTRCGAKAAELLKRLLVWDAHSGFSPIPEQNLEQLRRWEEADVDYLSINVGFDAYPWERTVLTLAAFRHWIAARPERFLLVDTVDDIRRAKAEGRMAIAFDLEGAVSLNGQLSMLQLYHELGVRQMHFVYNLNNEAGGGCQDDDQGLTDYGRDLVREANRLGVILDMSHVGRRTTFDIIEASAQPVVFSHSNPKALVDHPRNITEEQMRACAATGGLVGVTGVGRFLGDPMASSETFVRAIDMTVERIGIDHTAIGLDFNWKSASYAKARSYWPEQYYTGKYAYLGPHQLPEITELLLARGYSEADIGKIYGGNYLRVASAVWR
jgi:membrane dipeptidase